ncbi:hypothetical protein BBP40_009303 [Aspergillus hancockii]|nr:hypothetical protein BBP40_009303 [Aspergillus hancockii]
MSTSSNSGAYGATPSTGYTGGPPASLQPGGAGSGYNQQQQSQQPQYQAYLGSPAPSGNSTLMDNLKATDNPKATDNHKVTGNPKDTGHLRDTGHLKATADLLHHLHLTRHIDLRPDQSILHSHHLMYIVIPHTPLVLFFCSFILGVVIARGSAYPPQNAPYPGGPARTQQPGPPGPPGAPYGPQGGAPLTSRPTEQQVAAYHQLLIGTIQEKNLQSFYPPEKLDRVVQSLANDAPAKIAKIVHEWAVPQEVATDIIKLSLFDVILYVDDSGSIEFEERGVRKEQLRQILGIVATAASTFDQDGISVRFMNSMEVGDGIRSVDDVNMLVSRVRCQGLTPLGTSLKHKVLDPMVVGPARAGRLEKPVLIITITDGQPAGEPLDSVANAIRYAVDEVSRTPLGRGAVSFQFSQVGNDAKARDFLSSLDEDPTIGSLIDCTSNFEVEQDEMSRAVPPVYLTRELWCAKLMLGAIDSSYDTKDEKAAGRTGGAGGPRPGAPSGQYGGYNPAPGYSQQGRPNQPPPPSPYGSGPGYNQAPYPPSQGQPPAPGYGQTYGGYGTPSPHPTSSGYGQPPAGATRGYPPPQSPYGYAPPAPPRY